MFRRLKGNPCNPGTTLHSSVIRHFEAPKNNEKHTDARHFLFAAGGWLSLGTWMTEKLLQYVLVSAASMLQAFQQRAALRL